MLQRFRILRRRGAIATAMTFVVVGLATAPVHAAPATSSLGASLPKLETWKLDNGLEVAFMQLTSAPVVTVQVWYHVGSKEEARDRRGSAHMFEHMMFKGTQHVRPEEHARHIDRLGGEVNAFTTEDTTAYHNTLPKEYLSFAMRLEAERMRNLMFRPEMVATEREVVKEEIRNILNNPILRGFMRFLEIAYTKHPYAWTAGGAIEDLDNTNVDELRKFYDTYYVPNNAMLVVVGDVTADEVRAAAAEWFGPIEKGGDLPRPADDATEPAQTEKRREVLEPAQIGLVIAGYHVPEAKHDDVYPLEVAELILAGGESSRLNMRLVRKDKVSVAAFGQTMIREHPGLFLLGAAYPDPTKGEAVEAALFDEVAKLRARPPTAKEVTKAKNQLLAGFVFGLESATGLARQIGQSWIVTGDPGYFLAAVDRYQAVTPADVQRVAKQYLVDTNLTEIVIPPMGAGAPAGGSQ